LITTHELDEAELLADYLVILHRGHEVAKGTLSELAGEPELIVETSGPVDAAGLATLLGCKVITDGPLRLRCAVATTPERINLVTTYLTGAGVTMVSLRTRASLEERYLELIGDERSATNS
jgi:ABC-type multidrug transport system ATPase subunit